MSSSLAAFIAFDAFWAGAASLGFAVLFNVPARWLPAGVLLGALGHSARAALVHGHVLGLEASTLAAATLVGFAALAVARRGRVPIAICALPASIPMVPGAYAFKTMLGVLRLVEGSGATSPTLALEALVSGAKTALLLTALVVGVGSPYFLFHRSDTTDLDDR